MPYLKFDHCFDYTVLIAGNKFKGLCRILESKFVRNHIIKIHLTCHKKFNCVLNTAILPADIYNRNFFSANFINTKRNPVFARIPTITSLPPGRRISTPSSSVLC